MARQMDIVRGRPVGLRLAGEQVHDTCKAEALIETIPAGAALLGDKGHGNNTIREAAAARDVWANNPNRSSSKQRFGFSPWLYRQRNLVECFSNRINQSNSFAPTFGARRNESALQSMPLPTLSCRKNGENHNVIAHLNNLNPDHIYHLNEFISSKHSQNSQRVLFFWESMGKFYYFLPFLLFFQ
ncbi:MAG: hypothetical protein OC190_15150 [Novosphingobium aromaticivorans]|nr:hypothetical protein [Novosphingobium aromaticivorans]